MAKQERFKKVVEWKERDTIDDWQIMYWFTFIVANILLYLCSFKFWFAFNCFLAVRCLFLLRKKREVYYVKIKEVKRNS